MGVQLRLLDHTQLNSHISANFACEYSEDGKIFLLLESGVSIFTLKGNMDNIFPRYFFKKHLITLSETTINEYLDIDISHFLNDLSRNNLYESILNVELSGNEISANPLPSKPVSAMWSPRGIVEKTGGVIAVLTNLHNIEVFVENIDENETSNYLQVASFARDISEHYRKFWKRGEALTPDQKLAELRKRVEFIIPTAFTWSHVVLKDRKACCVLFVGHTDGSISAWRFLERKATEIYESKLQFLDRYNTKLKKITAMHWFCQKSDAGGLSFGDVDGHIGALCVSKLSTDKIRFTEEIILHSEDDIKVEKLSLVNYQSITYLVAVKHNYLQIFAINNDGEVSSGKLIRIGNLYITGLLHYEKNVLLVLSICGQVKEVTLAVTDNELVVTQTVLPLDIDTNKYRMHGFLFSPNKVFLSVLSYPCQLKDLTKEKGFVNFFTFANKSKDSLQVLMNISVPSLRDYWDCFETLRLVANKQKKLHHQEPMQLQGQDQNRNFWWCNFFGTWFPTVTFVFRVTCLQDKVFPWKGLEANFNYDTMPLLKLKILRWISKLSERIYPMIPRIENYSIKSYVLLNYVVDIKLAMQRMTKLLNIYFSDRKLSLFQMQSLDLLNFFLKEAVVSDVLIKANLGENCVDEIYNVMKIANELQYPPMPQCVWCGEKLIGSTCVPKHADTRCAISLMPLHIMPGYKCPFCNCVVSKEMGKEYYPIFCPYCDIPMRRRYVDKKFKKSSEDPLENTKVEGLIHSDCSSDCLKEEVHFSDIEDKTSSFIVLTDSEDENGEMTQINMKFKNIVLANFIDNQGQFTSTKSGLDVQAAGKNKESNSDDESDLDDSEGHVKEENDGESDDLQDDAKDNEDM